MIDVFCESHWRERSATGAKRIGIRVEQSVGDGGHALGMSGQPQPTGRTSQKMDIDSS